MIGRTLAHYQITEKLGAGGMGEVWRARDTRLNRDVALKFLPAAFAQDPERLARFEREAHVLAQLNHQNIAAIHGFEHDSQEGLCYLVLEYVPGQTLPCPAPLEDALPILHQLIDALEEAHETGIVHRDLKPANIKITPEGKLKVLDFGLAKALADEPPGEVASNSPTLAASALTRGAMLLGTAAYMSPEQARGKRADKRSDIFAFGSVLYEMLAGKQAFGGETISDSLAAILTKEPDRSLLPEATPAGIRRLLDRCLEKDLKRRLRDIGEARVILEETEAGTGGLPRPRGAAPLAWSLAAAATLAAAVLAVILFREKPPPPPPTTRFQVSPLEKATSVEYPSISPDGRRLAFVATVEGKTLLYLRPLDSLAAQALTGTDDAAFPFWSPDSKFLAFFTQGKLKKVDVSGGPPQTLCNAETPGRGGAWNHEGVILFGAGARAPLLRVPAAGGAPAPVTTLDSATELAHRWPHFLPDGRGFLYWLNAADREKRAVVVASLDDKPGSKDRKRLLAGESMAVYSAGHLLFDREGTLMAQPFDAAKLEFRGDAFPFIQEVAILGGSQGWAAFSASPGGTLAYRTGGREAKSQLAWFDRTGKELERLGQPEEQGGLRLSPDGKRVAVHRRGPQGTYDLWLLEPARDTSTRFTFHAAGDIGAVWSPDGSRVVFASNRDGQYSLYQKLSSGSTNEELLLKTGEGKFPNDCSADGRFVLYQSLHPKTASDLWALPLDGDRKPLPVVQTESQEVQGQFSPGPEGARWIAYQSNASALDQIYVQAFPKPSGKFQVSTNGGVRPRWRRDGKELFYLTPDRKLMAVGVKVTATTFEAGRPRELFQTRAASASSVSSVYDVTADGQRFLIDTAVEAEGAPPITVVTNWAADGKR